ncbi:uncharacterized protein LOC124161217 isoform X2 [Ischnura elegans]|uniref:uncharacterized protein LOC124161217 isoform X2 n=1 Tax=Ischnura elegans TaxID=197161 RepID=UPI001ED8A2B4|nr:uncharacterized protein LOC124161217 isoform X2 [Ischnura elegans]
MESNSGKKANCPKGPRYYVTGAVMNVEEDRTHEFKGHRNIAIEEIPPWCIDATDKHRKTRNCISRNICGFLNSGLGGIIYLGVLDDGSIAGIFLSRYQRDHLTLSLKDTLGRFRPPVPSHLVSIDFVPCVDLSDVNYRQVAKRCGSEKSGNVSDDFMREHSDAKDIDNSTARGNSLNDDAKNKSLNDCDNNSGGWDWVLEKVDITDLPREIKYKNDPLRKRPHLLRTYKQCWCDDDAITRVTHVINLATDLHPMWLKLLLDLLMQETQKSGNTFLHLVNCCFNQFFRQRMAAFM